MEDHQKNIDIPEDRCDGWSAVIAVQRDSNLCTKYTAEATDVEIGDEWKLATTLLTILKVPSMGLVCTGCNRSVRVISSR